jgi:hypothetical protein
MTGVMERGLEKGLLLTLLFDSAHVVNRKHFVRMVTDL